MKNIFDILVKRITSKKRTEELMEKIDEAAARVVAPYKAERM